MYEATTVPSYQCLILLINVTSAFTWTNSAHIHAYCYEWFA